MFVCAFAGLVYTARSGADSLPVPASRDIRTPYPQSAAVLDTTHPCLEGPPSDTSRGSGSAHSLFARLGAALVGVLKEGVGAFLGALFAFVFFMLQQALGKDRERQERHWAALRRLEFALNDLRGRITTNKYIIRPLVAGLKEHRAMFSMPRPVVVEGVTQEHLQNDDLVNGLLMLRDTAKRVANDIENLSTSYREIRAAFFQGIIDRKEFDSNSEHLAVQFEMLLSWHDKLDASLLTLLAKTRCLVLRDLPRPSRFLRQHWQSAVLSKLDIEAERENMKAEMEKIREESKREIEEIHGPGSAVE